MSETAFIVTDGAAGNQRQAEALAAAMGVCARSFEIRLTPPWSWLAPRLPPAARHALPSASRIELTNAAPEIVIGCGRSGALASRWLRSECSAYAIQILDPRIALSHWDLVIAPAHDGLSGDNLITTIGALNLISPARLAAAAIEHAALAHLASPRTAVLIGGSTRAQRIDRAYVDALLERLAGWYARQGGSFLVSTSRRSDPSLVQRLRQFVGQRGGLVWAGPGDGPNPYMGFLAHAERIVVTPDSVNLLSEAAATGKPVYSYPHRPIRGKLALFHRALIGSDHLRELTADLPEDWHPAPLRETDAVAQEVWRRFRAARRGPHR